MAEPCGCGELHIWAGMSWSPHTQAHHDGARRCLLRSARDLMDREADLKLWRAENAAQSLVGIRWRNGVYPGWQSELRSGVPYEVWDHMDRSVLLREMRTGNAWLLKARYGVEVNQATWFHRVYDDR